MKKRLLVVDDNKAMVELIKEYFSSNKNFEVSESAYDGGEAWEKIRKNHNNYDALLLDLIMPKKDGIFVLNKMKEENINLKTIVVTSYNEQETIRDVSELGVRYLILKPFDLKDLESKLIDVTDERKERGNVLDLQSGKNEIVISKMLHDLGIPSNMKGYQYLREAILMVYSDPSLVGAVTRVLYPRIGDKFNTTVTRVERAIRHAIEVSWNRGDWDLMEEIFGHSVDIDKAKPTNSEFIVTIADKLKLDKMTVR